jgi:hypothetical protein
METSMLELERNLHCHTGSSLFLASLPKHAIRIPQAGYRLFPCEAAIGTLAGKWELISTIR